MRIDDDLYALAQAVGRAALARRTRIATAESCTGGLAAGALTAVAGSSDWFECGVISGWHLPDTEHIVVTVSSIGTENTRPARRPKGPEPTDR